MWLTKWFVEAGRILEGKSSKIDMHMCMHGGDRPKSTTLWQGTAMSVAPLAKLCNGKCSHLPWSMKDTAKERRYPLIFCERFAKIAKNSFMPKQGKVLEEYKDKVLVEAQPRRGMQEIIAEYESTEKLVDCSPEEVNIAARALKDRQLKVSIRDFSLNEGYKVVSLGGSSADENCGLTIL